MFFEKIKTPGLAHLSYFIATNGVAIVIDPKRDIDDYLRLAIEHNAQIKYVIETHRQEDFVIGSNELHEKTGAKVVGGRHPIFNHCDIQLEDGEFFKIEDITLLCLATPGHTPEGQSYGVYLEDKDIYWGVFTGDTLFVGDTGRTDLPDPNKTALNAKVIYNSIRTKIAPLGDQAIIFPAHGSGSVCGGSIANYDQSTIGFEKSYNPVFTMDESEFVEHKLSERIPRPPYFSLMEKINYEGGWRIDQNLANIKILKAKDFLEQSKNGIIIDTRAPEAFASGHIPNSYNIWLDGLQVFGGWFCRKDTQVYLVLDKLEDLNLARLMLSRIGVGRIKAALANGIPALRQAGLELESFAVAGPKELFHNKSNFEIFDVREITEYESAHIEGSKHCFVGHLEEYLLKHRPSNKRIATLCSVGHRGAIAASIFAKLGYKNVYNILGGMNSWKSLGLPIEEGHKKVVSAPKKKLENAAQWGSTH